MDIVSRNDWRATGAPGGAVVPAAERDAVVVHHSAGEAKNGIATIRGIERSHESGNGWADIGYNFLITPDGTVYEGRGWDHQGAHAGTNDGNRGGIGVCIVGTYTDALPTAAALESFVALKAEADRRFGRLLDLKGHRDYRPTACPGSALYGWVNAGMPLSGPVSPADGPMPVKGTPGPSKPPGPSEAPSSPGSPAKPARPKWPAQPGPAAEPAVTVLGLDKTLTNFPVIKRGSDGSRVATLQGLLIARGYDLGNFGPKRNGIDSDFGATTDAAVKRYQRDVMNVRPSSGSYGLVGPNTIASLIG